MRGFWSEAEGLRRETFGDPENPALEQGQRRSWRFADSFSGVTQKVKNTEEHSEKIPAGQEVEAVVAEPLKIGASTPYDFSARNLTAYGGLLPVATMLEKLGFQQLVEETLTIRRQTRAMPVYQFVLGMVLVLYVGFSRLNHLRFVEREPSLNFAAADCKPPCCGHGLPPRRRQDVSMRSWLHKVGRFRSGIASAWDFAWLTAR